MDKWSNPRAMPPGIYSPQGDFLELDRWANMQWYDARLSALARSKGYTCIAKQDIPVGHIYCLLCKGWCVVLASADDLVACPQCDGRGFVDDTFGYAKKEGLPDEWAGIPPRREPQRAFGPRERSMVKMQGIIPFRLRPTGKHPVIDDIPNEAARRRTDTMVVLAVLLAAIIALLIVIAITHPVSSP